MAASLVRHDAILRGVADEHHGFVFAHTGDGMGISFPSAQDAVDAAVVMQLRLQTERWSGDERLLVRMGIHTGEALFVDGSYRGPTLNRAARVSDAANGDQIVVSGATAELLSSDRLECLGECLLKGLGSDELWRVVDDRLVGDHRPLRLGSLTLGTPLPPLVGRLFGRDAEAAELGEAVLEFPLVTAVGMGGIGKTTLAVAVAGQIADQFANGAVFCDFASIGSGDAVADAVALAIGARQQPGMTLTQSIDSFLRDRAMLVVLDNCEHVIEAVRQVVPSLLGGSASRVLATSREPMRVVGERVTTVEPLDPTTDGVRLFLERASERDAGFQPSVDELDTIAEVCVAIDGIPLAIELAAARVRVLTPSQLLERLNDRFAVLTDRSTSGRHARLLDTVQWSYEQLDEAEALLFQRLSVFSGGFDLEAVEAVCSDDDQILRVDVVDLALALVDKSLLHRASGTGRIRFRLLETLRQYGEARRLEHSPGLSGGQENGGIRARHASYFAGLVQEQSERLLTSKEASVWDLLSIEWGNIRAAFGFLLEADMLAEASRLTLDLAWYSTFAMRFEGLGFAEQVLATPGADDLELFGSLLGIRALLAYFTADDRAADFAERGLEADPDDPTGLNRGALSAVYLNNVFSKEESDRLTSDWLSMISDDIPANRLWAEGMRAFHLGSYLDVGADQHARNTRQLADQWQSASASALASWAEGMATVSADPAVAEQHWLRGLDSARSLSSTHLMVHLISGLRLHFLASFGGLESALQLCIETLHDAIEQHYMAGTSHLFGVAGIILARAGEPEAGAVLLNTMIGHGHQPRSNARRALTKALGYDLATYSSAGPTMSIHEAGVFAIEQLERAATALVEGVEG